jgi:hypothetical protein
VSRDGAQRSPPETGDSSGLLFDLLACAANASAIHNRILARHLANVDDRQFSMVFDAGLAPLLYLAVQNELDQLSATRRDALKSADLTAQVRHGNLVDTATEVIDTCNQLQTPVTLLKGISISDQHYPAAHLRPMGDIDLLISTQNYAEVEAALLARGYVSRHHHPMGENPYHGVPLQHPKTRVWVELHTGLFPHTAPLQKRGTFSPLNLAGQSIESSFHGRSVRRLTDEFQLVYTASFWMRDLSLQKVHPSFVPPLFDAVYLLKGSRRTFDWNGIFDWLDNELAIASLYVVLSYIARRRLHEIPPGVLSRLLCGQKIVGAIELRVIHAILDRYLIGGKAFTRLFQSWHVLHNLLAPGSSSTKLLLLPWNIVFPSLNSDVRYSVRYQLERIKRVLRRTV